MAWRVTGRELLVMPPFVVPSDNRRVFVPKIVKRDIDHDLLLLNPGVAELIPGSLAVHVDPVAKAAIGEVLTQEDGSISAGAHRELSEGDETGTVRLQDTFAKTAWLPSSCRRYVRLWIG